MCNVRNCLKGINVAFAFSKFSKSGRLVPSRNGDNASNQKAAVARQKQ